MKLKLIDEWKQAHKLGSVQISALMASVFGVGPALLNAWGAMPDDLKAALPHGWAQAVAVSGFILVLLARVLTFEKGEANAGSAS